MMTKIYQKKILNLSTLETFLVFLLVILLDQSCKIFVSKIMIINNFNELKFAPFLNIVFVRNTGISFGLFSEYENFGRVFFSSFSVIVGSFLIILALLTYNKLISISLAIISGGAIGNAIDRIYFGGVIDFIDIFIYNLHWPSFNLADAFITLGVFLLLIEPYFRKKIK